MDITPKVFTPVFRINDAEIRVGRGTYGNPQIFSWGEGSRLIVGNYCSFADGIKVMLGGEHRSDWVTTYPFSALFRNAARILGHPKTKGDIVIGHDVWIGMDATILSGVTIGNGAVIGAGSVVTKDVDPYAIVAGNPVREIRFRFSPEKIAALQRIAWWLWPEEKIEEAFPLLLSPDVDAFIERYRMKVQDPALR